MKYMVTPAQYRDVVTTTVQTVPVNGVAVIETNDVSMLDTTVKQFRAAAYEVVNGQMTVDEAVAAYGTIPTD